MRQSLPIRNPTRRLRLWCEILSFAAIGLSVGSGPRTHAATVVNLNDSGPGSLRQAIADSGPGDMTIDFAVIGTIRLTSGELTIDRELTILGPGVDVLQIDGNDAGRVCRIQAGNHVTISRVTVQNGNAANSGGGGGIWNEGMLTLSETAISGNLARFGGGIWNDGVLTLTDSTIAGNRSIGTSGSYASAGGIYNSGTLAIRNSTVRNNTADASNARGASGGGICNFFGTMTLIDSTVSNNTASDRGGGIYNGATIPDSIVSLSHCTVSNNSATDSGGGISNWDTLRLANTIVANNVGWDCSGTVISLGHNLDSDGTCDLTDTGDLSNTDPLLGPLADNGGPTLTHALLDGSPAIDAGSCEDIDGNPMTTDQRGVARPKPQGGACDIGAYEVSTSGCVFMDTDRDSDIDLRDFARFQICMTGPQS